MRIAGIVRRQSTVDIALSMNISDVKNRPALATLLLLALPGIARAQTPLLLSLDVHSQSWVESSQFGHSRFKNSSVRTLADSTPIST